MMLALSRYIPAADHSVKAGEWKRKQFTGVEVYKKTWALSGLAKLVPMWRP
jgi:D-3-phosphoglycerate dehydrogenase